MVWYNFLIPRIGNFLIGLILIVLGVVLLYWNFKVKFLVSQFRKSSWINQRRLIKAQLLSFVSWTLILIGLILMFLVSWIQNLLSGLYGQIIFGAVIIIVLLAWFMFGATKPKNRRVRRR